VIHRFAGSICAVPMTTLRRRCLVGRLAAAAFPEDPDYAWGASSVSPKQMLLVDARPGFPNCDVRGRDPLCPLHVDSSRPLCANTGRSYARWQRLNSTEAV
jgi:hypothetical protein